MVSLEQLKKDQIAADNRKVTDANLQKRSILKENQDRYEKAKIDKEEAKNLIERDERKLEEIENKKNAATSSLRNMIATIKGEYEKAKNDPNSLFRDFFRKDVEGNLTKNLDGMQVREIDEIKKTIPKVKDNSKEKISIQKRNKERKSVKENAEKIEEELYPKTKEYIKENYIDKNIGSYVDNLDYNYKRDPDHFYPSSPFKNLDDLAKKDTEQIENVKVVFEEEVEKSFEKKEKESGLLKLKENIEKINNFRKEAPEVLKEMDNFESDIKSQTDDLLDNFYKLQTYIGSNSANNTLYIFGINGYFERTRDNIKESLYEDQRDKNNSQYNSILNLEKIKSTLDIGKSLLKDLKILKEEFIKNPTIDGSLTSLYKKHFGKEFDNISVRESKEFVRLETKSFSTNNFFEAEDYYNKEISLFKKEENLIKNYGEIYLDVNLKSFEIANILHEEKLSFFDFHQNSFDNYSLEGAERKISSINRNSVIIKNYIEDYKARSEYFNIDPNEKITLLNGDNELLYPRFKENVDKIKEYKDEIEKLEKEYNDKYIKYQNESRKEPFSVFGKRKKEHDDLVDGLRNESTDIDTNIRNKKLEKENLEKIENRMWSENNLSIFREIYSESIFKEDENNNVKQVKDIFSSLIQKEKNKEEIYFKDYQKAVEDFLEEKEREQEEMQEIIKDSHIEEKLSEYKEKMKDYKQSVEELKKYYKEKNNKN